MRCLSTALLLFCGFMQAAEVVDLSHLVNVQDEASARRLNSLMEAYIMGRFVASNKKDYLKYPNHEAVDVCQETAEYEDTIDKIKADLELVCQKMGQFFSKELELYIGFSKLKLPDEKHKINIQVIRLRLFIKHFDMDFPEGALTEMLRIQNDTSLSEHDKEHAIKKITDDQKEDLDHVIKNRLRLMESMQSGDRDKILEASKQQLHRKGGMYAISLNKYCQGFFAQENVNK